VTDRLGSVRYRKGSGAAERVDYYPYGEEKPGASVQDRAKWATYMRDDTGLDYADQRYFTNTNGRFVTPDPAGDGMNWYGYAGGDPVNNVDPTGLCVIAGVVYPDGGYACPVGTSATVTEPYGGVPYETDPLVEKCAYAINEPMVYQQLGCSSVNNMATEPTLTCPSGYSLRTPGLCYNDEAWEREIADCVRTKEAIANSTWDKQVWSTEKKFARMALDDMGKGLAAAVLSCSIGALRSIAFGPQAAVIDCIYSSAIGWVGTFSLDVVWDLVFYEYSVLETAWKRRQRATDNALEDCLRER
jgi:RHS repeat-associated protein